MSKTIVAVPTRWPGVWQRVRRVCEHRGGGGGDRGHVARRPARWGPEANAQTITGGIYTNTRESKLCDVWLVAHS
jgi:hypothetical protein